MSFYFTIPRMNGVIFPVDEKGWVMSRLIKIMCCFWIWIGGSYGNATIIQILHTNDSHSFLDHSTNDQRSGGVARLKSLMDFYKDKMRSEGGETLTLDAGDFTEGNLYFMADLGRKSFIVQSSLGYDAVTLGNHDYLMGSKDFNDLLGELDLKFSFLAANITVNSNCENVQKIIKPFFELTLAGKKIGIYGVTSDEAFYKWRFLCGKITDPIKSALLYEDVLRKRKNDLVIGLTHLGLERDIKLAHRSKNTDIIIGGHTHSILEKPVLIKNLYGKPVPILQAGYHTKYLGRMLIDVIKNFPPKIISYELLTVNNETTDMMMNQLVMEANNDLLAIFGVGWLETIVGHSSLEATDLQGEKKWAYFIADTIKEKVNAEIGIHSPTMNGEAFPVGKIDRKMLLNSFPRIFDLRDKKGWSIYTTTIKGAWLQLAIDSLTHLGEPMVFSGLSFKYRKNHLGLALRQILVHGKKINPYRNYKVALTEGVMVGAAGVSRLSAVILRFPQKSPYRIWTALEEKLASPEQGSKDDGHVYIPRE
jgi:2',3'-cyclic-nucleotide 2'-phosphodiesterase (5'-nucleotidase family)